MHEDLEKVKLLAGDLRDGKEFPRSPRATLACYVLAARAVDKCRAVLVDWQGEYHSNCPLDQRWLNFAEIHYGDFRSLVATGATDDEIAEWIEKNAKKRPRAEIVAWNNKERDLRLSDLPPELQEYMENYIHRYVRVTASCITGSTCTIWKNNGSDRGAVATALWAVFWETR
jgi:hypothetical protein